MKDGNKYLIDTNSLITPQHHFYPFDFAPRFWEQMKEHIASGKIAILDMVKAEILQGTDELQEWFSTIDIGEYIDRRESDILVSYSKSGIL